jgi:hypothetical protein
VNSVDKSCLKEDKVGRKTHTERMMTQRRKEKAKKGGREEEDGRKGEKEK